MPFPRSRLLFAIVAVVVVAACGPRRPPPETIPAETARQPVNYFVRIARSGSDAYDISMTTDRVRRDSVDFVLTSWVPGQYGPLSSQVQAESFSVRDGRGDPVATRRISATRWRLYPDGEEYLTVAYLIVPDPPSEPLPFRTRLDLHAGYALGAGLFGYLEGLEARPIRISFDLPSGWRASAPLQAEGPNRFSAAAFGELPATPFVVGDRYRDYKLFQRGRTHQVVVEGAGSEFSPDSLLALVDETIRLGTDFYGGPDYERYMFAIHFVPPDASGIGGTGHAEGASIFLPEMDSAHVREAGMETMLLHQYLHAWLPGSFGPRSLVQPDWSSAPRASDLWLIEGVAEYYARLLPVRRTGGSTRSRFYDQMGALITLWRELGGGDRIDPSTLVGPVIRGGDDRSMPRLVAGGALAAFLLDLEIRDETRGLRGLEQLLYYLQKSTPVGFGYGEEVWAGADEALALPTGTVAVLTATEGISLEAGLERAGLRLVERAERRRTLGARLQVRSGSGFVVASVDPGGTAASAGLREGDRILSINGTPIGPSEVVATRYAFDTYIASARSGTPIRFAIERDGTEEEVRGQVRESRVRQVEIQEVPSAPSQALIVRASLFQPTQPVPSR
ncbi:MAG TPA: PDZ domain-containing protein [Gemmatimonadota bacterium]|nr:PDZ domain-containing protein [Gemmatimonadota bacterium]